MLNDFCIVHRRKPATFTEPGLTVWATCLRSLAFVSPNHKIELQPNDAVYSRGEAYRFLLEVICGLHSPILGETEVFGQFKNFAEQWVQIEPQRKAFVQRLMSEAKQLRSKYLSHLGTQSYGSWLRKNLKHNKVHILGGGQLVREILPYLTKQGREVVIHVRDPRKVDFHTGRIASLQNKSFDSGALIVAAPLSAGEIEQWLGGVEPAQIFDLRDNSCTDLIARECERHALKDIFRQIEQTRTRLLPVVEQVKSEIQELAGKAAAHAIVRPQGWDDLCA